MANTQISVENERSLSVQTINGQKFDIAPGRISGRLTLGKCWEDADDDSDETVLPDSVEATDIQRERVSLSCRVRQDTGTPAPLDGGEVIGGTPRSYAMIGICWSP